MQKAWGFNLIYELTNESTKEVLPSWVLMWPWVLLGFHPTLWVFLEKALGYEFAAVIVNIR